MAGGRGQIPANQSKCMKLGMPESVGRKRLYTNRSVSVAAATFRGRPGRWAGVVLQAVLKRESACWVVQNLQPSVARVSVYVIMRFMTAPVHMA
jgi:hypothetical protein